MRGVVLPPGVVTILILLAACVAIPPVAALTPDGLALLEFKRGLTATGPLQRNWHASDATPCRWGGVTCTRRGAVLQLNLTAQALEGAISPSLGMLKSLEGLYLTANSLSGRIPPELGNCTSLASLYLDQNRLSGEIPADLGRLTLLGDVALAFNELTGEIPSAFAACPQLYSFDVGSNFLTGRVPPVIYENPNLTGLYVNNNNLSGDVTGDLEALSKLPSISDIWMQYNGFGGTLPPSLGNATTLSTILVNFQSQGNVNLGGRSAFGGTIPKEIGKLVNLTDLDIRDNNFTGSIPPELGNLSSLQNMYLSSNHLTGSIPREFGQLQNLQRLDLYQNKLTGPIPPELGDCTSLTEIILYMNNLDGGIPASLGKLANLLDFDVYDNNMSGPIPPEIFNCTNLQTFSVDQNGFSGAIPPQIGQLAALGSLRMNNNSLSGPLPAEIANLTSMFEMVLNTNALTGVIPAGLSNITTLCSIYLFDNRMAGPLPPELGMLSNLSTLDLRNNSFNGTLPPGLCHGGNLSFVDIQLNEFEGAVPSSLATCKTLVRFRVGNNRFRSLPDGFGDHGALDFLDLSSNRLEGTLPRGLGANSNVSYLALRDNNLGGDLSLLPFAQLRNLHILDLSMNNFTGEIPAAISACTNIFLLDLSSNALSGIVPASLGNLKQLQTLKLQGNDISGVVPGMFSQFINMNELDLAENPLGGPIPAEIGGLMWLSYLNLSYGEYSGPIPLDLGNLLELEVLDLSHNALTGPIPAALGGIHSLLTVNVSYNNLTGSLPAAWVEFLAVTPSAFAGNPGLCLPYSAGNQCLHVTPAGSLGGGEKRLGPGALVAITISSALLLFVVGVAVWWCSPWKCHAALVPEPSIEVMISPGSAISFHEIMAATENLSDGFIIGKGGHGTVYKALLASGTQIVVKKIVSLDKNTQVHKSFWTEIETIGIAKHRNLVKLLGFCKWGEVGLLLYDYVSNGDLHEALHNKDGGFALDWPTRLRIAKGVAHGLAYLHHDYVPPIVHRDIKASNVLLDDDLEPHISDFGIAKVMDMKPKGQGTTSTTLVTGTYGYIAPEYGFGTKVTPKVDVYSYGVLLLELLTGRQPVDPSFGDPMHIAAWVRSMVQKSGATACEAVLDPRLLQTATDARKTQMLHVLRAAVLCTKETPLDRPTMPEVVEMLRTSGNQNHSN